MQKTLKALMWAYVLFAITDLALTALGLYFVGSDIELNPIIRLANPYVMVIIIKAFVIWVGFVLAKDYVKAKDFTKFNTVSFIVLCAFLQFVVTITNGYMMSKIDYGIPIAAGKASLVKTDAGFDYYKGTEKVAEVNPIKKDSYATVLFYAIIAIFAIYPMLFANVSYWLKQRIDNEKA
jgi:hypothetical protein